MSMVGDMIRDYEKKIERYEAALKEAKQKLEELAGDCDNPKRQTLDGNYQVYEIITKALNN